MIRCLGWLIPTVAGVVLQTTPTGCDPPLSSLPNTLWQDLISGIGSAITHLAEVLILTLIA
jgi:hypothetical protein